MARKTNLLAQEQFIAEYLANGGVKLRAANKLKISYSQVKKWFVDDEEFKARIAEAESQWMDGIRAALMKRAMEKSDTAAIFLLKAHDPEQYDDNIRKAKYLNEHGFVDPDVQPIVRAVLVREPEPERLQEVVTTTNGANGSH